MSKRLDKDREQRLQPERMKYATEQLAKLGFKYIADETKICFQFNGHQVTLFPYSGWHTGKSITDGRGLEKLLKQLKP